MRIKWYVFTSRIFEALLTILVTRRLSLCGYPLNLFVDHFIYAQRWRLVTTSWENEAFFLGGSLNRRLSWSIFFLLCFCCVFAFDIYPGFSMLLACFNFSVLCWAFVHLMGLDWAIAMG